MKVLKFEEYVNERLFQSSMDRISSGEKRKGDVDYQRENAKSFIDAMYDYAQDNEENIPKLFLIFTSFLKLDDNDFKEDENDIYPDWGINEVLDKYTLDEFLEKCEHFIFICKTNYGSKFNYRLFKDILEKE